MTPATILHFSATGLESALLARALSSARSEGIELDLAVRTQIQLSDKRGVEEFTSLAMAADAVILTLHGGPESFPGRIELEEALEKFPGPPIIHVQPEGGDLDAFEWAGKISRGLDGQKLELARRYLSLGGVKNLTYFLGLIASASMEAKAEKARGPAGGRPAQAEASRAEASQASQAGDPEKPSASPPLFSAPPPEAPPFEGLYHPDRPVDDEAAYLAEVAESGKPVVGIWFYHTWWLNGVLGHIDTIIRAFEERGAAVIAVFHTRWKDADLNNPGADSAAARFLLFPDESPRIDVLISPMSFSLGATSPDCKDLYGEIGVPVIQAVCSFSTLEDWAASARGLSPMDVALSLAQPEMDGNIMTVPFAFKKKSEIDPLTGAMGVSYEAHGERAGKIADLALNWARLRRVPNSQKRLAVIFHHYPPRNDRIGCAAGLDSFQSVAGLLKELKSAGYFVPKLFESGDEIAGELLSRPTPDKKWLTTAAMFERAEAKAGPNLYLPWTEKLPEKPRAKMESDWGEAPGELMVHEGQLLFSGFADGNVFVCLQPSRGHIESLEKGYHDPWLSAPHQYLAQYRWLRDVWGAMAVIHVGKHGSLEWLPGKGSGLSQECLPDLAILDLPNIYPYIVNDPGEGTQAKRRSYAVIIDHMLPDLTTGGLYGEAEAISQLMHERSLALMEDPGKSSILAEKIWEAVKSANFDKDLSVTEEDVKKDFEDFSERLHSYLGLLCGTMMGNGLHVLGVSPEGQRLSETVVELTKIAAPGRPALREAVAGLLNLTLDDLEPKRALDETSPFGPPRGAASKAKTSAGPGAASEAFWPAERVRNLTLELVEALRETDFDYEKAQMSLKSIAEEALLNHAAKDGSLRVEKALERLKWVSEVLVPDLRGCAFEMSNTLSALSGGFVPPGPSGAPSRGQTEVLPTGRAFYSVDPRKIPSPAAWKVGQKLGEALLSRYLKETGTYPKNVGILVYATSAMRTRGDDIAEILFLWGLRPVWRAGGMVDGLEAIPLKELGRPRIDVTARISGLFRDAFPNMVELLDKGAAMAAALSEPLEENFLRAHVLSDLELLRAKGLSEEEAEREATFRVFGCPPGTYGAGVAELVESGRWQTQKELGEVYIKFSGHAYGAGNVWGLSRPEGFRRNLARMDATIKNEDSREYDLLSCTDYYNYYGGLIAAAKAVRGKPTLSMVGDASDPERVKISTTVEESRRILRVRLVNPKWIEGLKRHGFKGAGEISHMMDVLIGWDATADIVEDWMWEAAAKSWVLNPETAEWLDKVNPFARRNMLDKLLEAIARNLWTAPEGMEDRLKEEYLELEGKIEEMGDEPLVSDKAPAEKAQGLDCAAKNEPVSPAAAQKSAAQKSAAQKSASKESAPRPQA
ncbi:MAG: cobaltochelatase subunit CobN [Deltaproteobacteria bacterium]|jgi:cobaltochelatase CobN|nr:cobaltochelatase subunit CobN [Deltaproteobacteria bacterium]